MKTLLVIIDGLSEKPIAKLGGKTPLEKAKTPNLDFLAKNGICGQASPFWLKEQKYPRSDTAHLALLGYDPKLYYLGRGPYEVAGIEMDFKKGDIALRANFGTVDKNLKIIDRRVGRISRTEPLINALSKVKKIKGIRFFIKKSYGHRAGLILRGKNLSDKISDGDPYKVNVKVKKIIPLDKSFQAKFTAEALNQYLEKCSEILNNHPLNKKRRKEGKLSANCLLLRGAGKFKETPGFQKKHKLKAACIAGGGLYKGIGRVLGMDLIKVKGANGFPNTNLKGKFSAAKRILNGKRYNFVFLHIKAADNLAEDGSYLGKKNFIEKIDKAIKLVFDLKNTLIVVTADHSTCSSLKRHCLEPVPVLMFGKGKDKVNCFSEKACRKGNLGKIKGIDLMKTILKLEGK